MDLYIFLGSFVFLTILGMPIAFAMIVSSVIYALMNNINLGFLTLQMFTSMDNFILLAIPFFILAAEVMNRATITKRIFDFANAVVGFIPGGLGHVNIVTSVIFSGMSGSAVADVGGIGKMAYESMVDRGFDKPFSGALTIASAVIGPIIPPSLPMVVYAMVANVSLGRMFFGGIGPGLLMGVSLMIYVYIISKKRNYPISNALNVKEIIKYLLRAFFPLLTPLILLGGIYSGVVTITEAAALAVLYAIILGRFAYKIISLKVFFKSLQKVIVTMGPIVILFPAAKVFGFVLTSEQIPQQLSSLLLNISDNPILLIFTINIIFLIVGCFSDPLVNIMLFVPIFLPLIRLTALEPVHFGVMIVLNTMIGLITPPVGSLLIAFSGISNLGFENIAKETIPFIFILLLVLIIIILIPQTVLFIPNLLFGN